MSQMSGVSPESGKVSNNNHGALGKNWRWIARKFRLERRGRAGLTGPRQCALKTTRALAPVVLCVYGHVASKKRYRPCRVQETIHRAARQQRRQSLSEPACPGARARRTEAL